MILSEMGAMSLESGKHQGSLRTSPIWKGTVHLYGCLCGTFLHMRSMEEAKHVLTMFIWLMGLSRVVAIVCAPSYQPVIQSLHNTPSPFNTARCPLLISFTVRHLATRQQLILSIVQTYTNPANAMVIRNSAIKILIASSTPCCPLYCQTYQSFLAPCSYCCNLQQAPISVLSP